MNGKNRKIWVRNGFERKISEEIQIFSTAIQTLEDGFFLPVPPLRFLDIAAIVFARYLFFSLDFSISVCNYI
jgi:hypothetical protein